MGLSLEKKKELVGLSLAKHNIPAGIKLRVKACTDVSGSIQHYFINGTMQELFDRLLPVAMRFDDDGSLESYAFGTDCKRVDDITAADFGNYVNRKFLQQVPDPILWSGTKYSRALNTIFGSVGAKFKGFFSKFGGSQPTPTYLMFTTDGETNGDEDATEELIKSLIGQRVYIQFIGVGPVRYFDFLKRLANEYGHVGFCSFPDLDNTSDQKMYEELLNSELCAWIKEQK